MTQPSFTHPLSPALRTCTHCCVCVVGHARTNLPPHAVCAHAWILPTGPLDRSRRMLQVNLYAAMAVEELERVAGLPSSAVDPLRQVRVPELVLTLEHRTIQRHP